MGLLRWLGFVKLADYGLELTRDHRIRIHGWTVLDDGKGGPIVGWTEGDAAIYELNKWQLVKPQSATPRHKDDDDEWDWMIVAARARAEAPRVQPPRVEPPVPPKRVERPRVEPEATFDDQPTQARIADELPTRTWLDGHTEIDPPRARMARGTPSPESMRRSNAKREDPWKHDATVPAPLVAKTCAK